MAEILVVDDSSFARKTVVKMLTGAGHSTLEAASAEECFDVLASSKPDVVVLDLLMPVTHGREIIKEMNAKKIGVPVVVLTADTQSSVKKECMELGVAEVLHKPIAADKLLKAIAGVLAK